MSVIVKGVEMPKNCKHCPFMMSTICNITNRTDLNKRQDNCPLVELPEHHGRLIDADSLDPDTNYYYGDFYAYSCRQIDDAETIFEPEYGKENNHD